MISNSHIALVAALIKHGTAIGAAKELGISVSTMYRHMRTNEFQVVYQSIQSDCLRIVSDELNERRLDAVETICEIMNDETVNAAIRLQAAQTILTNDKSYSERLRNSESKMNDLVRNDEWMDYIKQKKQDDPNFKPTIDNLTCLALGQTTSKSPAASQKPKTQYQIDPEYD